MKNKLKKIFMLLPLISLTNQSNAGPNGTATGNMLVTATIQPGCTLQTNPMPFGIYTSTAGATATAALQVVCTVGLPYVVSLNAGVNGGGTVTSRMVKYNTSTLPYGLYRDSTYKQNWGMTNNTDNVNGLGTGTSQTLTVYGQMPTGSSGPAGTYSDTIVVSVDY